MSGDVDIYLFVYKYSGIQIFGTALVTLVLRDKRESDCTQALEETEPMP